MKDKRTLEDLLETARFQHEEKLRLEREAQEAEALARAQEIETDKADAFKAVCNALPESLIPFITYPTQQWQFKTSNANRFLLQLSECVVIGISVCMTYDKGNYTKPLGHAVTGFKIPFLFIGFDDEKGESYITESWNTNSNEVFKTKSIIEALGIAQQRVTEREALEVEATRRNLERQQRQVEVQTVFPSPDSPREQTVAERLECLVREIVREEIYRDQG
jgi:hypothetical protein